MADIQALVAEMNDADRRAALARIFGEEDVAHYWDRRKEAIELAMLRSDMGGDAA